MTTARDVSTTSGTEKTQGASPYSEAAAREHANRETVRRFAIAWAGGDVDTLMSLMSDDPVYKGSTGPGPGTEFRGRDNVRAAFLRMVGANVGAPVPVNAPPPPQMHFFGNHALVYWHLSLPTADSSKSEVDGVDVLTFASDGRIAVKDAYRKAFS